MSSRSTSAPTMLPARSCAWTKRPNNWCRRRGRAARWPRGTRSPSTTSTSGTAPPIFFRLLEPWAGRRHVAVTARRTALDYARVVQELVDVRYPTATTLVLVHDNLNTHVPASLYAAFPPTEARRLLAKLEIHYTPKHGSWLNMAETELSILSRQCLSRRIGKAPTLVTEVA